MRLLRLIICFNVIISCNSNEEQAIALQVEKGVDTLSQNGNSKPAILFDNHKPFQVVDAIKGVITAFSASESNVCQGWTVTAIQVAQVIKDAEPINRNILHYQFLVLPCIVKGQIMQESQVYKYEINGGSWISITSADTALYYGSYKKRNEKYFLEKADYTQ